MPAYSTMALPFDLGTTIPSTDQNGAAINTHLLGQVYTVLPYTAAGSAVRTTRKTHYGGPLTVVALKNASGVTVYGKTLVALKLSAGLYTGTEFNGYSGSAIAQKMVVLLDPYLPAAGAANNEICWCVLRGPALCKTPRNGEDFGFGDIAVGDPLIANGTIGAGTTSSTTAGKIAGLTVWGGATVGITQNMGMWAGVLGNALSARTTGNTDSDILVWWKNNIF
jgi:hypothetical protein